MLRSMKKNKKGTIGDTLVGIPTFLFILFLLLVYLVSVLFVFGGGYILGIGKKSEINLDSSESIYLKRLENQKDFAKILNYETEGKTLKEWIERWQLNKVNSESLKEKIEKVLSREASLGKDENECYLVHLKGRESLLANNMGLQLKDIEDSGSRRISNFALDISSETIKKDIISDGSASADILLFKKSGAEKIKYLFYKGKC